MKLCMFWTHLAIVGSTILEIVAITILLELFPFGCHISRRVDEIVLFTEVVPIVCFVDALNVIQKLFERLSITVVIEERRKGLVELAGAPASVGFSLWVGPDSDAAGTISFISLAVPADTIACFMCEDGGCPSCLTQGDTVGWPVLLYSFCLPWMKGMHFTIGFFISAQPVVTAFYFFPLFQSNHEYAIFALLTFIP